MIVLFQFPSSDKAKEAYSQLWELDQEDVTLQGSFLRWTIESPLNIGDVASSLDNWHVYVTMADYAAIKPYEWALRTQYPRLQIHYLSRV